MTATPEMVVSHCRQAIRDKHYGHADTQLREYMRQFGPRADMYIELANLDLAIGEVEVAKIHLRQALAVDSACAPARQQLKQMGAPRTSLDQLASPDNRCLLIKAWGQGFWSDVSHVAGACLLAEHTNRAPIVYWGKESRYRAADDVNAWTRYFEPVSHLQFETLAAAKTFWPPKWRADNLDRAINYLWSGPHSRVSIFDLMNRPEDVVVADFYVAPSTVHFHLRANHPLRPLTAKEAHRRVLRRYIRPTSQVLTHVEELYKHLGQFSAAIHLRSTDKFGEDPSLRDLHEKATAWAADFLASDPSRRILLLTDAVSVAQDWKSRYPDNIVMCDSIRSAVSDTAAHFQNHDGARLGLDILTESLLALKAEYLIGSMNSNVTNMIYLLKDWPPDKVLLTGADPDEIVHASTFDYRWQPNAAFETRAQ